jgi:hypothetical protein
MDSATRVSAHYEKKEMAPVNCTIPLDENLLPITLKYGPTVEAENKLNSTRFPLASLGKEFTYLVELLPDVLKLADNEKR